MKHTESELRLLTSFTLSGGVCLLYNRKEGMNSLPERGDLILQIIPNNGLGRKTMSSHDQDARNMPQFVWVHLRRRGFEAAARHRPTSIVQIRLRKFG